MILAAGKPMPDGTAPSSRDGPSIDRKTLAGLSVRSDAAGWRRLGAHALLLIATGVLVWQARGTFWVWPAMLIHGVVLVFLFAPLHETIHRTAFAARAANEGVAFVLGALILLPHEYFRAFHFAHHRFTQDPARDPELAMPRPATLPQWLWAASGLPYWIGQARLVFRQALGRTPEDFYKSDSQRAAVVREARILLGVYAAVLALSLAAGSTAALVLWVVPALLGQPFLRLYLMAEHTLCPLVPDDMWSNSRTTKSNGLVRFLAWNMPYHGAHHAYPSVPFHALPALDRLVANARKTTAPGYFAVQKMILAAVNAE
jgi:fatty acid desaturase